VSSVTPELIERVGALVADALQIDRPAPEVDLIETGIMDSLGLIELIHSLEVDFAIMVPLDEIDLDRLRTLDGIADLVAGLTIRAATDAA
jgi:acyl carrier protein